MKQITKCEVCDCTNLEAVLNLGNHPLCDDLIPIGENYNCSEYPIEILYCKICNTAHQRFQVEKKILFPKEYHYRSRFTSDVLKGMESLVNSYSKKFGSLDGKNILDIGSNDGSLLDCFKKKGANITFGVEPTNAYLDSEFRGHKIINGYFDTLTAEKICSHKILFDVITFTNVFAHIDDLKGLLSSLKKVVSKKTIVIIENHYLGSVLDGYQFDTFYHEHPRTYSLNSFLYIAKVLGMDILDVEFPVRYGGNIRVFLGQYKSQSIKLEKLIDKEGSFLEKFKTLNQMISIWSSKKKESIFKGVDGSKVAAKAFPGRSAILIKMLGLNEDNILAVYEKVGSMKIGHYVPGTRIPILSDEDLFKDISNTNKILNLAWHISSEIENYLNDNGFKGDIIQILDPKEYSND